MDVAFRVGRADALGQTKPVGRAQALERLGTLLKHHQGPVSVRKDPHEYGREAPKRDAITKLQEDLRRPSVRKGDRWFVKTQDAARFVVLAVDAGLPEAAPNFSISAGNDRIQKIVRVAAGFSTPPRLKSLGGFVCKYIAGTRTASQHCMFTDPQGCNAWDLAVKRLGVFSPRLTWQLVRYLVDNAMEIELGRAIFQDRMWQKGVGWTGYGGVYHGNHVHVEPDPERPTSKLGCSPS